MINGINKNYVILYSIKHKVTVAFEMYCPISKTMESRIFA